MGFEARLRHDVELQQLNGAVSDSSLVGKAQVARMLAIQGQQREVSEAVLSYDQFIGQVKLAPDAVKAYYDSHPADFVVPEQVRAEFAVLNSDALAAQETVSEADMHSWYDSNVRAKVEERAAAKKKAEDVLAQLRAEPDKFAELAKQYSQDPGSKDNGGDLGFFTRGDMVKPFEDAVFKLKPGQLSGIVESSFGFHIIKLTGIKPAKDGEPEQRRASHILIAAPPAAGGFQRDAWRYRKRAEKAASGQENSPKRRKSSAISPTSSRTACNRSPTSSSSSCSSPDGSRARPATADGVLNNQKILDALFSPDAVKNKHNTEAVEVAPQTMLVAARVIEHKAASVRPLDEVKDGIAKKLIEQDAMALAVKRGAADYAELQQGKDAGLAWGAAKIVGRQGKQPVDRGSATGDFRHRCQQAAGLRGRGTARPRLRPLPDFARDRRAAGRCGAAEGAAGATGAASGAGGLAAYIASLRAAAKIEIIRENLEKKGG